MYVTPGIKRPGTKPPAGQKRVFTSGNAIKYGSSFIVVGRAATDPFRTGKATPEERKTAAYEILQDMVPYV